jgi:hypothetical protein
MAHNERHAFVDVSTLLGPAAPSLEALLQAEQAHQKAERIKAGIQDRVVDIDRRNRNPELGFTVNNTRTGALPTSTTTPNNNPLTSGIEEGKLTALNNKTQADESTILKSLLSSSSNGGFQPTTGWDRLFATLERMGGRGSGGPPGGSGLKAFLGDFLDSSGELRADEAQAGLAQQEQQNAIAIEQAKLANKEVKLPTLTGEDRKVIDQYYYGVQGTKLITAMKNAMLGTVSQGGPAAVVSGFSSILSALGLPMPETGAQITQNIADQLKQTMAASGILGRETSRTEFNELLDKLVQNPGFFNSEEKVEAALGRLSRMLEEQVAQAWRIAKQYGIPLEGIATDEKLSYIISRREG